MTISSACCDDQVVAINEGADFSTSPAPSRPSSTPTVGADDDRPLLEFGLMATREVRESPLATQATQQFKCALTSLFPEFHWTFVERAFQAREGQQSTHPILLLEAARAQQLRERLDFTLVICDSPLLNDRGQLLRAVSAQAIDAAVVSIADAEASPPDASVEELAQLMLQSTFAAHGIGAEYRNPAKDRPLTPQGRNELLQRLHNMADTRLEEERVRPSVGFFYLRAAWLNRGEIWSALIRIKPWLLPLKLSKLSAGAVSGGLIVMLTAETWEIGTQLCTTDLVLLATTAFSTTLIYLCSKHRVAAAKRQMLREQRVVAECSVWFALCGGMVSLFTTLTLLAWGMGRWLYTPELVARWTGEAHLSTYPKMATLAATFGMAVGTLGASLETPERFRYVVLADEEF